MSGAALVSGARTVPDAGTAPPAGRRAAATGRSAPAQPRRCCILAPPWLGVGVGGTYYRPAAATIIGMLLRLWPAFLVQELLLLLGAAPRGGGAAAAGCLAAARPPAWRWGARAWRALSGG